MKKTQKERLGIHLPPVTVTQVDLLCEPRKKRKHKQLIGL